MPTDIRDEEGVCVEIYDEAHALARRMAESELCRRYAGLRDALQENQTAHALVQEYKRLQMRLQMQAMGGGASGEADVRRFEQLASLLYATPEIQQFLLTEMQVQKMLADVVQILTDAAGVRIDLPDTVG
ncbi:MAG: YlbF family regulator [Oscillospiraceae bacterium]|jgi:cell fate (sporulation/competence/biofilm development) regulator YlbF (YheA/YmcA/DUF963 family)|nr:YlbF family regulator [Oscillospiraceae bacterium]